MLSQPAAAVRATSTVDAAFFRATFRASLHAYSDVR
jgi:hypothetical protein